MLRLQNWTKLGSCLYSTRNKLKNQSTKIALKVEEENVVLF